MPLLAGNTTESFGIQLGGTGTVSWVLSCISELAGGDGQNATVSRGVTAQGTAFASGFRAIPSTFEPYVHGPATRELQFFSAINQGAGSNVVTLGKVVSQTVIETVPFLSTATTFFQFSPPALLNPGESLIYVREAGFFVYDVNGLLKVEAAAAGTYQSLVINGTGSGITFPDGSVQLTAASPTAATYCAVANISNAQSIPSGSYTAVSFDTVVSDPESQFSGGTTFTAKQAGLYQIQGSVRIAADGASGYGMLTIYHNGNPCGGDSHPALSGAVSSLSVGMTLVLAAGDTIQLAYFQNSGSSVTTAVSHTNTVQFTAMSIALLAGGG